MKLISCGKLLGPIGEYAAALTIKTPYKGYYRSFRDPGQYLSNRFSENVRLSHAFYGCVHSGSQCPITNVNNPPYDFINPNDITHGLNVKTVVNNYLYKITPGRIGQPSKNRFCQIFGLEEPSQIKKYIQTNPHILLDAYFKNAFEYPILIYHAKHDQCLLIKHKPFMFIPWERFTYSFSHQRREMKWNDSSPIAVTRHGLTSSPIGEFQLHNQRNCVKFRFSVRNLLLYFPEYFIVEHW